ncbi:chemotaxis protein CheA [Limnobacter litoralis]|uniref:Chemotaxis protein CheA n=1 Tax=Limnobacter litoralis TaxID=481366 RepID=A0ABQ5YVX5_9BURK|nr:chemotaxis protein CheA [Limnobacter litoralis]GLR27637.1 chemotaxis protein CheA [Limnobacter litoralis]
MAFEFDLESSRGVFYTEARQLLGEVESYVLQLEQDPHDTETLNAAFRAAHTIKGSAGVFGLSVITHFVHDLETVLDRVRNGEIAFDGAMSTLVLECRDHISNLVDAIEGGGNAEHVGEDLAPVQSQLTKRLQSYLLDADRSSDSGGATLQDQAASPAVATDALWHISVRLGKSTLCDGFDPAPIFGYLSTYGAIEAIIPVLDKLPAFSDLDPEGCYLGFELRFRTDKSKKDIEEAFEFLTQESQLRILPHQCSVDEFDALVASLPEEEGRALELLEQAGFTRPAPQVQLDQSSAVAERPADAVVNIPVSQKKKAPAKASASSQLIRVPSDKLDALINLVGELVIANAGTVEQAKQMNNVSMLEATSAVAGLIEEIRDGALGLRMVQIGETFQRFQRVVRDISMGMGKQISLDIRGEETELDKSVVEKIGDPLMHLVRNALDHGLETPAEREAAGKPLNGRLGLHAYHDSGHIVIEVSDDGRGLVRDKILKKALEKGIVTPEQTLSDAEVNMLIFAPGFSTADQVTDISGRGVGMDVVKRNIEALRGSVQVRSEAGKGTTFEIRLPLTLAIIDGFTIGVGNSVYVIPLGFVRECLELPSSALVEDDRMDIHYDLRGEFLPCVRLRKVFDVKGPRPKRENIIVVSFGGVKAGIVTDQLHGESQTVIKPLGTLFEQNKAISGATILGSGDVALIIDVPKLIGEVAHITARQSDRLRLVS